MRNLIILLVMVFLLVACKQQQKSEELITVDGLEYFVEEISKEGAINSADFFNQFIKGDSIEMKVIGKINEVCKKKGCWMSMSIGSEDEMMVRFKDYGFFVPLNAD